MDQLLTFIKTTGNVSSDVVILLAIFFVSFFYTIYFGKNRTISLILAYYPSLLFYKTFPFVDKLMVLHGDKLILLNKAGIFLLFLIPISIIINRYIFSESIGGGTHFLRVGGLALASVILVLLFAYTVVDLSVFHDFGGHIDLLFATPDRVFWVNLAPFAFLAFL